jgi:hypothetical protein
MTGNERAEIEQQLRMFERELSWLPSDADEDERAGLREEVERFKEMLLGGK